MHWIAVLVTAAAAAECSSWLVLGHAAQYTRHPEIAYVCPEEK
jgi:hypothetical protein